MALVSGMVPLLGGAWLAPRRGAVAKFDDLHVRVVFVHPVACLCRAQHHPAQRTWSRGGAGVCWHTSACAGVCWRVLACTDVRTQHSTSTRPPHGTHHMSTPSPCPLLSALCSLLPPPSRFDLLQPVAQAVSTGFLLSESWALPGSLDSAVRLVEAQGKACRLRLQFLRVSASLPPPAHASSPTD